MIFLYLRVWTVHIQWTAYVRVFWTAPIRTEYTTLYLVTDTTPPSNLLEILEAVVPRSEDNRSSELQSSSYRPEIDIFFFRLAKKALFSAQRVTKKIYVGDRSLFEENMWHYICKCWCYFNLLSFHIRTKFTENNIHKISACDRVVWKNMLTWEVRRKQSYIFWLYGNKLAADQNIGRLKISNEWKLGR